MKTVELNEQQVEWLQFFIKQDVLDGQITYTETSKAIAQQIISKFESE